MSYTPAVHELVKRLFETIRTHDEKITNKDILSAAACVAVHAIMAFPNDVENVETLFHRAISTGVASERERTSVTETEQATE